MKPLDSPCFNLVILIIGLYVVQFLRKDKKEEKVNGKIFSEIPPRHDDKRDR